MFLGALSTVRDLGRLHRVGSVLVRHGLGDTVRRLGMARILERAGRALSVQATEGLASKPSHVHFREALEELGPTFVKVGQLLAARTDLLPPAWTDELGRLREGAQAVPWSEIHAQLAADLGAAPEQVFVAIDTTPLAAASIAQVHRARLPGDREVVLKVRRPGIAEVVEADLHLLERLAHIAERELPELAHLRPRRLVRAFARTLRNELDLRIEARHVRRLAANLAARGDLVVPGVHAAFTRERLLVMDYLPGPSLGTWMQQGRPGTARAPDVARRGADAVLAMVFLDGFFHADPHAGNVLLLPDGRLGLLDFGMVGSLPDARRLELLELLGALVTRRDSDATDILLQWTRADDADADALAQDVGSFVDRWYGLSIGEIDATLLLADLARLLRENGLFLPDDIALLLRVFVVLEGLGRALDPGFDIARSVEPFVERAWRRELSPFRRARRGARELHGMLLALPRHARQAMRTLRRGRLRLEVDLKTMEDFGARMERSANRLTFGLVVAALIVGTAISLQIGEGPRTLGLPIFAVLGFVSSIVAGVWLLVSIARSRKH